MLASVGFEMACVVLEAARTAAEGEGRAAARTAPRSSWRDIEGGSIVCVVEDRRGFGCEGVSIGSVSTRGPDDRQFHGLELKAQSDTREVFFFFLEWFRVGRSDLSVARACHSVLCTSTG